MPPAGPSPSRESPWGKGPAVGNGRLEGRPKPVADSGRASNGECGLGVLCQNPRTVLADGNDPRMHRADTPQHTILASELHVQTTCSTTGSDVPDPGPRRSPPERLQTGGPPDDAASPPDTAAAGRHRGRDRRLAARTGPAAGSPSRRSLCGTEAVLRFPAGPAGPAAAVHSRSHAADRRRGGGDDASGGGAQAGRHGHRHDAFVPEVPADDRGPR